MGDLRDIPGIGEKTARRLIEHFGSAESVLEVLQRHDVAAIAKISGISEKNAVSIVRGFMFRDEHISPDSFLKTREAHSVYNRLLDMIKSYTSTPYARDKLNIFFPMPSIKKNRILSVREYVAAACSMVDSMASGEPGIEGLKEILKNLRPIKKSPPKKIRDRVIATPDHGEYEQALSRFGSAIGVILVGSPRELVDTVTAYHHVTASMKLEGIDLPGNASIEYVDLSQLETWQAVPESVVDFYSRNLRSISSAIEVYNATRGHHFFSQVEPSSIIRLRTALETVGDDGLRAGSDPNIDRLQTALERLDECIKTAQQDASDRFKKFLENSTITLSGQDLLEAAGGGAKDLLDREMAGRYREITRESVRYITKELGLIQKESLILDDLFSREIMTPIQAKRAVVEGLRSFLKAELTSSRLKLLRETARNLSDLEPVVRDVVSGAMELDMWFAIGLFARDRELVEPLLHEGAGIEIEKGRNLFLGSDAEPVDYALGKPQLGAGPGYSPQRVAILSGVNSGGKTSTLDLIAQTLILCHMGFPVPAGESAVGLMDELYYFGKSRGTMDAGAFESTIREFSVVAGNSRMAMLVDELESITEPGASARIIGGILETLNENPQAVGVFVSHMAEHIMEHTAGAVRVDGIEATGLDGDLNLIVDRNPRYNYVAKSTPELIVARLARQADGEKQVFYQRLLDKFK